MTGDAGRVPNEGRLRVTGDEWRVTGEEWRATDDGRQILYNQTYSRGKSLGVHDYFCLPIFNCFILKSTSKCLSLFAVFCLSLLAILTLVEY